MPQIDHDDTVNREELQTLQAEIQNLPLENIDRDLAELSHEIEFLEAQVEVDLGSYSPEQLARAYGKIAHLKRRAEILKIELNTRNSKK
jgi:hypothetical protein